MGLRDFNSSQMDRRRHQAGASDSLAGAPPMRCGAATATATATATAATQTCWLCRRKTDRRRVSHELRASEPKARAGRRTSRPPASANVGVNQTVDVRNKISSLMLLWLSVQPSYRPHTSSIECANNLKVNLNTTSTTVAAISKRLLP